MLIKLSAVSQEISNNVQVLKAIAMDVPNGLAETWIAQREKEREELTAHKHITLTMSERMMMDDEESSE